MYERFYGLRERPFSLTPDPSLLYPSRQHVMALTLLEYGLESQVPFVLLTGEIGSGKTTLLRRLLSGTNGASRVGLVNHTHARFGGLLGWVVSAFGIVPADDSEIAMYEAVVDLCVREYAAGKRVLLIIDEAQNLTVEMLEELRLLSNINSDKDCVLQIFLVGQPELRDKLRRPELRQFAQRIAVDYHLSPLTESETHEYVGHRMRMCGGDPATFDFDAITLVHQSTGGVPRLVNQLCDFALVYGFAEARHRVDEDLMQQVVRDRVAGGIFPGRPAAAAVDAAP